MSILSGSLDVPVLGPTSKAVLVPVVGAAAGFVLWRYYVARTGADAGAGDGGEPVSDFEAAGDPPGVIGAVSPTNSYGGITGGGDSTQDPGDVDSYGFHGTTNSQWTQWAAAQLAAADRWSYADIVTALGNYLAGVPMTRVQVDIAHAATALAGPPPVGGARPITPGGNTEITVAPTGLRVSQVGKTSAVVDFSDVAGAAGYRAYSGGSGANIGSAVGSKIILSHLNHAQKYSITVSAITASGKAGPRSRPVVFTTKK